MNKNMIKDLEFEGPAKIIVQSDGLPVFLFRLTTQAKPMFLRHIFKMELDNLIQFINERRKCLVSKNMVPLHDPTFLFAMTTLQEYHNEAYVDLEALSTLSMRDGGILTGERLFDRNDEGGLIAAMTLRSNIFEKTNLQEIAVTYDGLLVLEKAIKHKVQARGLDPLKNNDLGIIQNVLAEFKKHCPVSPRLSECILN